MKKSRKEYMREYRAKNADKIKAQKAKYREENRERINKRFNELREEVKDERNEQQRQKRKENPTIHRSQNKRYYKENCESIDKMKDVHGEQNPQNWIARIRQRRKQVQTVSLSHLFDLYGSQEGKCAISGLSMTYKKGEHTAISIDRIDSSLGYEPSNVQLVCAALNFAKRHHSNESIVEFIRMVRESA